MSVEQAIFEILEDDSIADSLDLLALLPIERIAFGENHDRDFPYCSVSVESDLAEYRSNKGQMRRPVLRFQLWHENHAAGVAIRSAIERLFENNTFNTSESRIETRHENSVTIQEEDGTWQFLIDVETQFSFLGDSGSDSGESS